MQCSRCRHSNRDDAKFCSQCGAALVVASARADATAPIAYTPRYLAEKILSSRSALEGERKFVTVLFADIAESSVLAQQFDPERIHQLLSEVLQLIAEAVHRYEGTVNQYLGDGLMALFGAPVALEDHAFRAVQAALTIQETIRGYSVRFQREHGAEVRLRVGLNTGPVVVGRIGDDLRMDYTAVGNTTHLAARMQSLAEPGTILLTEDVHRFVAGQIRSESLGRVEVKGQRAPVLVYKVTGRRPWRSRLDISAESGLTRLVGRDAEVALLGERWIQVKNGVGQAALLNGEAGIGKSRLVRVLKKHVARESCTRIEWRCLPYYRDSALYPVTSHLQRALAWEPDETPELKVRKLERFLTQRALPLQEMSPIFASLLSLPLPERYAPLALTPRRQKVQTLEALFAWLRSEAERQPVLLIAEDLHWVDPSTLEFLSVLVERGPSLRIFSLFTFRPEFIPPWPPGPHVTLRSVGRLSREQVEQMLQVLVGGKSVGPEVVQQIFDKTDGVPLFVEEITKAMLESGHLREADAHSRSTAALSALAVPATLLDLLMARLDRLMTAKGIAQLAATIGRFFSYALVEAISQLDRNTLERELERLVKAELIHQQGLPPDATYFFRHALIQDAAYQSLLRSTRRHYHQRIAQVLMERFPESQPELLAHHFTEAGLYAQAVGFWHEAGKTAIQRSANTEAVRHLSKGLEVVTMLPETVERLHHEIGIQTALGMALTATKGYGAQEVEGAYARARVLCEQAGETPHLAPVLAGLRRFHLVRGNLRTALEISEQYLHFARRSRDAGLLVAGHEALGATLLFTGEFTAARQHLEQGIACASAGPRATDFGHGALPEVQCSSYLAMVLWFLGYPDQALRQNEEALGLARNLAHPYGLSHALATASVTNQLCREVALTQKQAEAMMTLSAEQDFAYMSAFSLLLRGWALTAQGHREAGIAEMRQGLVALQAPGAEHLRPYFLILLAEAYRAGGQIKEGLGALEDTQPAVAKSGSHFYEAELYRLKGELLQDLAMVDLAEAEACLRRALAISRRQHAKSLELRASTSLARLWRRQRNGAQARLLLTEALGWFTEGFTTPDFQEAKSLLKEMHD
jgi:class 3 adenylate cyclase/predicted ATPase